MKRIAITLAVALSGCASTGVIQTAPDVFMVSKRSAQAGFGAPVGARADVYKEASEFCAQRGQQLQEIEFQGQDSSFGRPASALLRFTCVPKT